MEALHCIRSRPGPQRILLEFPREFPIHPREFPI